MKRSAVVGAMLGLFCLPFQGMARPRPRETGKAKDAGSSINQTALDLYTRLSDQEKGKDLLFSPASILTGLVMAHAGAKRDTAAEMAKALHLGSSSQQDFQALWSTLRARTKAGVRLNVANALWGQKGYRFSKTFTRSIQKGYKAGFFGVDFARGAEKARIQINKWVSSQTKNKIKDLIGPGVLSPLVRLILTNAVHFHGVWQKRFDKRATNSLPFYLDSGGQVTTSMMQVRETFRYGSGNGYQMVELPYKGKKFSMVVLLPSRSSSIADLEQSLTASWLSQQLSGLSDHKVMVYLPRFTITAFQALKPLLIAMGMPKAFDHKADFTGMTGKVPSDKQLFLSDVLHKAFISVDEKGTEAAAATSVIMARRNGGGQVMVFRADRPFIFLIRDIQTNAILFLGRLCNPKR